MRTTLIVICILLNSIISSAQNWSKVGDGFNNAVRCFYADTTENVLYAGGNFTKTGSMTLNRIAKWNGIKWDSLSHGSSVHSPTYSITKYQGVILASGDFLNDYTNCLAQWNGVQWLPYNFNVDPTILTFTEVNNKLYFAGGFDTVGTNLINCIAIWDGTNLQAINSNFSFHYINEIQFLNNTLYMGGNFYDTVNTAIHDFAQWDGSSVIPVSPPFMSAAAGNINTMTVYNNELYVGGYFLQSWGDAGNYIMKWNGSNWEEVGGGVDNYVYNLEVYKGNLYASGAFDNAGGQPASKIARWDGNSWHSLGPEIFSNTGISSFAFLNDTLYVGGGFNYIGNDTIRCVAKYNGTLPGAIENLSTDNFFTIYPNPTTSTITLTNSQIQSYQLINLLGQVLKEENTNAEPSPLFGRGVRGEALTIDVNELPAGVYFIRAKTKDGILSGKFMKE